MCQVSFFFFPFVRFEIEVQSLFCFSNIATTPRDHDVIIINKTFYMSSRSYGETFGSIRQVVAEKNTKVLYGQTDRQTNGPKCNTLSFGEGNKQERCHA